MKYTYYVSKDRDDFFYRSDGNLYWYLNDNGTWINMGGDSWTRSAFDDKSRFKVISKEDLFLALL